jgi:hypothetical protein
MSRQFWQMGHGGRGRLSILYQGLPIVGRLGLYLALAPVTRLEAELQLSCSRRVFSVQKFTSIENWRVLLVRILDVRRAKVGCPR